MAITAPNDATFLLEELRDAIRNPRTTAEQIEEIGGRIVATLDHSEIYQDELGHYFSVSGITHVADAKGETCYSLAKRLKLEAQIAVNDHVSRLSGILRAVEEIEKNVRAASLGSSRSALPSSLSGLTLGNQLLIAVKSQDSVRVEKLIGSVKDLPRDTLFEDACGSSIFPHQMPDFRGPEGSIREVADAQYRKAQSEGNGQDANSNNILSMVDDMRTFSSYSSVYLRVPATSGAAVGAAAPSADADRAVSDEEAMENYRNLMRELDDNEAKESAECAARVTESLQRESAAKELAPSTRGVCCVM